MSLNNILKSWRFETRQSIPVRSVHAYILLFFVSTVVGYAQEIDPQLSESNDYVFEGNSLVGEDFIKAEKNFDSLESFEKNKKAASGQRQHHPWRYKCSKRSGSSEDCSPGSPGFRGT